MYFYYEKNTTREYDYIFSMGCICMCITYIVCNISRIKGEIQMWITKKKYMILIQNVYATKKELAELDNNMQNEIKKLTEEFLRIQTGSKELDSEEYNQKKWCNPSLWASVQLHNHMIEAEEFNEIVNKILCITKSYNLSISDLDYLFDYIMQYLKEYIVPTD